MPRASPCELRLRQELQLFARQWVSIVIVVVFLVYIVLMVFLNLSYWRYEAPPDGKRLKDLGHEIVPQIPDRYLDIVDLPLNILYFCAAFVILGTFRACVPSFSGKQPPFAVNILRRFGISYSMGHFLRACSYLVTSVPGGAEKCLKAELLEAARPTLPQCFLRTASVEMNCGDLMFSGHLLLCILIVCVCNRYAADSLTPRWGKFVLYFSVLCTMVEFVMILAARHHYTSDLIVCVYVTPLLWWNYLQWEPFDMEPEHLGIEEALIHHGPWFTKGCLAPPKSVEVDVLSELIEQQDDESLLVQSFLTSAPG